jgi:hypothetical protein
MVIDGKHAFSGAVLAPRFNVRTFRASEVRVGIAAGIAWLVFSWQYGFMISPDGWFRGVLAKSIVNGTPYWINLNQGYSYDHGVWHHNANHEPLLPVILAGLFVLFGPLISFLNIISAFCAGLLLCPLLALSRIVFGSWLIGLVAYILVAFNLLTEFFKEAMSGLSFPSAILVLLLYLVLSAAIVEQHSMRRVVAAGICLAAYYLSRGEAFAVCFFVIAVQYLVAPRSARRPLIQTWMVFLAVIAPWAIRKCLLFGDPFFSHASPLLFVEEGTELWSFPEDGFPTANLFIERHGWKFLLTKLFVHNPLSAWQVVQTISEGWAPYIGMLAIMLPLFSYFYEESHSRRFLAYSLFAAGLGSALILTQAPILDRRVTLVVSLSSLTLALGTLERFVRVIIRPPRSAQALSVVLLCWFFVANGRAIMLFPKEYLRYKFSTEDASLWTDPTIPALKARFTKDDVLLAPFANAQYLSFATGIGMVEMPANYADLQNPSGFVRRYNVGYSLLNLGSDVSSPGWEVLGHRIGRPVRASLELQQESSIGEYQFPSTVIPRSDDEGALIEARTLDRLNRMGRRVYVDSFHGGQALRQMLRSTLPEAFYSMNSLSESDTELRGRDILLVGIGGDSQELSIEDQRTLKEFLGRGGSLVLFGHVWVWATQKPQSLDENPLNQFLRPIGCVLAAEGDVASPPADLSALPFTFSENSVFSSIVCNDRATVILRTPWRAPIAITGRTRWGGRVLVWGHDEPLIAAQNGDSNFSSQLQDLIARLSYNAAP